MKASQIVAILNTGKKPLVKLTNRLWDDAFGQKGMIARIIKAVENTDNLINITFDFNEHFEHNISLDEPNWFIGSSGKTGTALEANRFKNNNVVEEVYFEPNDILPVSFIEQEDLLSKYIADKTTNNLSITYVEWLENIVRKANFSVI